MTAHQLAASFGVSAVAARKHLEALERAGFVRVQRLRRPTGRPAHLYVLTENAESLFPQRYRDLLLAVLVEIGAEHGRERVEDLLRAVYARTVPSYRARLVGQDLAMRVRELARIREEEGYMPSVEADGQLFVLREHHCPIRAVAERYPEVCRCERELFQESLGVPVLCRATIAQGEPACEFRVPAPVPSGAETPRSSVPSGLD